MSIALWALPTLPMLAGMLLALAGAVRPAAANRGAAVFAVTVSVLVVSLGVAVAVERPSVNAALLPGADAALRVDGLSAAMVLTVTAIALVVMVFSAVELRPGESRARFFGLMLLFVGSMLATVTATNLLTLLGSWEVMGAMSYALIGYWWRDEQRVRSGNTAFLVTRGADLGLYLASGAALAGAASLSFGDLAAASPGWRTLIAAGIVTSALGKSAQLPFAFWISRAMAGPSPVSALLHSATMVAAGGYLLLRMRPLLEASPWAGATVAWAGALTAVALGAVAVVQSDLKQLLAASTSAQIGFVVLAAGVGATASGTMQLIAHAAVKSALFLAAGAWLTAWGTKALRSLRGVARSYALLGAAAGVSLLALAGVPPLSLWATKDSVLAAARTDSLALYLVGLAGSVLSAGYAGRILAVVFAGGSPDDRPDPRDLEEEPTRTVRGPATAAVALLALAGALLGVQALPIVERRYSDAFGGASVLPSLGELALSGLLASAVVIALVVGRRRDVRLPARLLRALQDWLGLEVLAHRIVVRPTMALARTAARVDDDVIDRLVEGAATLARRTAGRGDTADARVVDGSVMALVTGARGLGRLARRPQTGQLYQYYVQVALGLVVLVVVVVAVGG